ncbi:voltage-dependent calcium channel subunit alpha-2/delta-1 isoform X4 [Denticeps clupeoides]|uniref:voltage-dependent calcium channel subunit alpha-2/delta-1 isoform X4 n=1 Tax=Denticeps clupeoides TaxID=299321 RepID=UPI0010A2C777|nr:voltage-dependent calcium channel subunit alpha-2/delta-1 isoform X4 [Denticeps clupeoides]
MEPRGRGTVSLLSPLLLLLLLLVSVRGSQFPTSLMIKEWVEQMQQDLVSLAETASGGRSLAKVRGQQACKPPRSCVMKKISPARLSVEIFMDHQKYFTVESNNAAQLVANAAKNIERLLKKRSRALEALATAAENLQMQHQWKDDFAEGDIVYYNAKDNLDVNETEGKKNRIRPDFKEDPSFKRLTSYNLSAVHIPTDIYDGSTIVLNELNWTEALEDVFKKNREDDPTLLWQVFGSATGLARYYPASPWMDSRKTPSKIDLYDVRRRPWYIQGAASPKDMLILVDASGSVSGLTLKLIRTSVSEMLETLSDDDYVNVVYFNTRVNNTACFDHLVQANVRNKKILKDAVQNITAKGITNYTKGFEFAFQQLSNPNITRANCNKIIMLFTDGGEERAQEVFEMYNPDKKVRIFTFSVGQHNYDTGPIQWMACANKGYFYEIPSIGAIRINTQEYLDVLGRPMVLADQQGKQVQWTNVYLDALELGLVITGTLPVFNKTRSREDGSQNQQNQLILGVMGIDVSLDDIKRLTPRFTIGPNGYYFAIDPNGYVLLHPNLQPKNPKFQEPVTLDFLDAELENDIKVQIRTMMIDGDPGEKTIETLVKSQDERYIDRGVRTYTWKPVNGTDYSLALVLPEYSLHYIQANLGDTIQQAIWFKVSETMQVDKFEEFGFTFIAPREYCKDLRLSENNTRFLVDFNEYIDRRTPNDPMCNATLVNRLLLDAGLTADLLKLWKEQNVEGVQARFVATDGGITRVYPKSAGEIWSENPETYESSFYKRSLDNDIYIFTAPYVNKSIDTSYESGVLVSKAVNLNIDGVVLKPAVVGVKLDVSAWMNSFMNATIKQNCKEEICGCLKNDQHVDCVILDDGGFLLMSNQDKYIVQIGRFFGEVDPVLMISLVNTSLYSFNKTYDYQSVCDPEKESKTAAGPRCVYVPTVGDMLSLAWWASAAAWSLLQQLLLSLTFPRVLDAAHSEDEVSDTFSKESCITEQTQYFFENENRSFHGTLDCGNCSRMYRAEKLPSTNLVFLISDAKDTCGSCKQTALRQAEQPSSGPDLCELAQNPRYRKGPDVCFDNNAADEPLCPISGSSALAAPSRLILFHVVFAVLWRTYLTVVEVPV